jgi:hypothetical protein
LDSQFFDLELTELQNIRTCEKHALYNMDKMRPSRQFSVDFWFRVGIELGLAQPNKHDF